MSTTAEAKPLKAPFPAFGGKSTVADLVWARLGDVRNYIDLRRCCITPIVTPCFSAADFMVIPPRSYSATADATAVESCVRGRPVCFASLLVDHLRRRRWATKFFTIRARYAGTWISKCFALLTNSKFSIASFSLFSSRWCTPIPSGIGPFAASHATCARSFQMFGSEIFTHARCSPPLPCRVRNRTVPTGSLFQLVFIP